MILPLLVFPALVHAIIRFQGCAHPLHWSERERERDVEYGYIYFIAALKGMTGYLAPFRYLANNKLDYSLIGDARVGIYDCHVYSTGHW